MSMVNDVINRELAHFNITANVISLDFRDFKTIPKDHNGIYIITQGESVVYVGKGQVHRRQKSHLDKVKENKNDTNGWRWLMENYAVDPRRWLVTYIILYKQTELSAIEGALIHQLQPLANDETFKDNNRILKEHK